MNRLTCKAERTINNIINDIKKTKPGRFIDLAEFIEGNEHAGTKAIIGGKDGGRDVILTVEKAPANNVAETVVADGYDFKNDIEKSRRIDVIEAVKHHLAIAYETFTTNEGELVAVSPRIKGVCLHDYYKNGGRFQLKDFRNFFEHAIDTQIFLKEENDLYQRDTSQFNLLVKKNGKKRESKDEEKEVKGFAKRGWEYLKGLAIDNKQSIEGWTVDLGSACDTEKARDEALITRGARTVRDPRVFWRNNGTYGDDQVVYALAQNMFVSLTGKPAVYYENIRNAKKEVHDAKVKTAIEQLPVWAKERFGDLLYNAMSSDGYYNSLEKFQIDFRKASGPGLLEKLRTDASTKVAAGCLAGVLALGALGGVGVVHLNQVHQKSLESAVKEASKYIVKAQCDHHLDTINNLLNLQLSIYDKNGYKFIYGENIFDKNSSNPTFLQLQRGQNLSIHVSPYEHPRPNDIGIGLPYFKGKLYFEGWEAQNFVTESVDPTPGAYQDVGGPNTAELNLRIPESMVDGNYVLVTEIYPQERPDPENVVTAAGDIKYEELGRAICRKRIPVVIGNPKIKMKLKSGYFYFGSNMVDYVNLEKEPLATNPEVMVDKRLPRNLIYETHIPELGIHQENNREYPDRIYIPGENNTRLKTVQLVVRDPNDRSIILTSYLPVRAKLIDGRFFEHQLVTVDPNYSDRLVQYRKDIESGDYITKPASGLEAK